MHGGVARGMCGRREEGELEQIKVKGLVSQGQSLSVGCTETSWAGG